MPLFGVSARLGFRTFGFPHRTLPSDWGFLTSGCPHLGCPLINNPGCLQKLQRLQIYSSPYGKLLDTFEITWKRSGLGSGWVLGLHFLRHSIVSVLSTSNMYTSILREWVTFVISLTSKILIFMIFGPDEISNPHF